ncbi:hypothetical protein M427DRAFT_133880 [Gonapodya prolifera JEL478]|uniref:RING-type domain-containing protein n=1 Tax=Gonapodya prolifera (strain JEL478) TaxID=1344416 RepID=A0A139AJS3_GONPJ|nr:hypothetical protein M427DRAFT_133880 [Gonapodya prolifera JEL478]|eukprot:KXS16804.1 hypothetical protein M427DRAFT_133880 [Gonapodya prolifera JEL478]
MPLSPPRDNHLLLLLASAILGALASLWVQRRARMQLAAAHAAVVFPPRKVLARLLANGGGVDREVVREMARKFQGRYVAVEGIVTPTTPTSVLELSGLARFVQAVIYEKVVNRHWTTYVPERREWVSGSEQVSRFLRSIPFHISVALDAIAGDAGLKLAAGDPTPPPSPTTLPNSVPPSSSSIVTSVASLPTPPTAPSSVIPVSLPASPLTPASLPVVSIPAYSATNPLPSSLDLPSVSKDFQSAPLSASTLVQPLMTELAAGAVGVSQPSLGSVTVSLGTGLAAGRLSSGLETVERAMRVGERVTALGYLDFYGAESAAGAALEVPRPIVEVMGSPVVGSGVATTSIPTPPPKAPKAGGAPTRPPPAPPRTISFPPIMLAHPPSTTAPAIPSPAKTGAAIAPAAPPPAYPHVLVLSTLPDYIASLRRSFATWRWASRVLVVGAFLLAGVVVGRRVGVGAGEWRPGSSDGGGVRGQPGGSAEVAQSAGEGEDLENVEEAEDCVVCLSKKPSIILLNCGHYCLCESCSGELDRCPVCRQPIARRIRTFRG